MKVVAGTTNVTTYFMLRNTSNAQATTGATITDIDLQYVRTGTDPSMMVAAAALAAASTAHTDNSVFEVDATDQPGLYRVDWPDAAFAVGAREVILTVKLASSYTESLRVELGAYLEVESLSPSAADDMMASYASLVIDIGEYLFGIVTDFSAAQTSKIERCIKHGLHDVYTAYSWSFFRPIEEITTTAPYDTGTITVVDGVVTLATGTWPTWAAVGVLKVDSDYYDVDTYTDGTTITLEDTTVDVDAGTSYELGRPEYDLPTAFEAIEGDLTYEPGQSDFYPPIRQKSDAEILRLRQDDPYHDRPVHYGVRTVEFDPTVGSRRRLSLYPTPDAAYVLKARMKLRATMIDSTDKYPVGGESLSQVITEACLAAAERNYDEQPSVHTQRFLELLPLAIAADQEATSPTQLGPDAPRGENADTISRSVRFGDLTLDGDTL